MATKTNSSMGFWRRVCVVFVLACIFFSFLPHMHVCEGNVCFLCELRELIARAIFVAVVCFALPLWLILGRNICDVLPRQSYETLVQLKVELLD